MARLDGVLWLSFFSGGSNWVGPGILRYSSVMVELMPDHSTELMTTIENFLSGIDHVAFLLS
jgi:hypothetical protein